MIDTEKYEGHKPAPWEYNTDDDGWTLAAIRERDDPDRDEFIALITKPEGNPLLTMSPDLELMADAPLLLEEVKRLREQLQLAYEWVGLYEDTHMMDTFTMFLGDDEE